MDNMYKNQGREEGEGQQSTCHPPYIFKGGGGGLLSPECLPPPEEFWTAVFYLNKYVSIIIYRQRIIWIFLITYVLLYFCPLLDKI